jgi:hypothetical protein
MSSFEALDSSEDCNGWVGAPQRSQKRPSSETVFGNTTHCRRWYFRISHTGSDEVGMSWVSFTEAGT